MFSIKNPMICPVYGLPHLKKRETEGGGREERSVSGLAFGRGSTEGLNKMSSLVLYTDRSVLSFRCTMCSSIQMWKP